MYVLRRLVKNKAVCSLLPQQVSGVDYARPLLLGDERSGRFLTAEEGAGDTVLGAKKTFGIDFSDLQ